MGATYGTLNVLHYIWNGRRAVNLKKTERGKYIIKKSEKLDKKIKEYVKVKSSKTR